jgi:hypothetical protein
MRPDVYDPGEARAARLLRSHGSLLDEYYQLPPGWTWENNEAFWRFFWNRCGSSLCCWDPGQFRTRGPAGRGWVGGHERGGGGWGEPGGAAAWASQPSIWEGLGGRPQEGAPLRRVAAPPGAHGPSRAAREVRWRGRGDGVARVGSAEAAPHSHPPPWPPTRPTPIAPPPPPHPRPPHPTPLRRFWARVVCLQSLQGFRIGRLRERAADVYARVNAALAGDYSQLDSIKEVGLKSWCFLSPILLPSSCGRRQ